MKPKILVATEPKEKNLNKRLNSMKKRKLKKKSQRKNQQSLISESERKNNNTFHRIKVTKTESSKINTVDTVERIKADALKATNYLLNTSVTAEAIAQARAETIKVLREYEARGMISHLDIGLAIDDIDPSVLHISFIPVDPGPYNYDINWSYSIEEENE